MYPHRIRLRGPWDYEPLARRPGDADLPLPPSGRMTMPCRWADGGLADFEGLVRFRRRFGYPGRIDAYERVWLTFDGANFRAEVTLNEYYVGVPAGPVSVGFSRRRFTEYDRAGERAGGQPPGVILDFLADDVDAEYERVRALGVEFVLPPTTQPWGNRTMVFRDPEGNLINVFSRPT